jgi:class 3 adenylate cyclase
MSEEDVQWLNREGQNYRAKSAEKVSSVENGSGTEYHQQYQTILNLYHSGIPIYIIALQLDINEEDVHKIIQSTSNNTKPLSASPYSMSLLENKFDNDSLTSSLDNTVNTDIEIKNAQVRMWKALRSEPEINLSMERTNEVLRAFAKSKVTLVTLNIDLVDSTELSISLPLERLSTILQTFMQEVASVIISYGGYMLKYVGDAVLGFFVVNTKYGFENNMVSYDNSNDHANHTDQKDYPNRTYIPCVNAINCSRSIIKILDQAINPILNQYGYPEMLVRIGIDIGENVVIQDGWDLHRVSQQNNKWTEETAIIREPHFDIIGYSTNIAVKMTGLAGANKIVIGQSIYNILDRERSSFKVLDVNPEVWKYIDDRTNTLYRIYQSI